MAVWTDENPDESLKQEARIVIFGLQ